MINTTTWSQILECQKSKTFTLFTVYFRHTIPSNYKCSVRIHKIACPNLGPFSRRLEMSLCQPSRGLLHFLFLGYREERGSKEREIGSIFHMLCPRYIRPLTPTAPLQRLGYARSLDLYLSRRQCTSRFRCTQLFNTTLPSFYITEIC